MPTLTPKQRQYIVNQVNANSAIEGLEPTLAMQRIQEDFVAGRITLEQLNLATLNLLTELVNKAGGQVPPGTLAP